MNTMTASSFSYTDSSVVGGMTYCYTVTAYNTLGGERDYSIHLSVVPVTVPSGMTAPTLVSTTLTSLTVQWQKPTLDGDSEVIRYLLYIKPDFDLNIVRSTLASPHPTLFIY